tara:strand:- start:68 stop:2533 length:2466 start_codon:yes stop_codon:yes gene_type:complete
MYPKSFNTKDGRSMQREEMGIQFGKYRIFSKLAVGGMAEVFLAKQSGLGGYSRTVVLKCILPHLAQQPQFVTMFLDEARVASQLNHPNICQIYEIGQVDGIYYIAMEYVRGQDLKKFRKRYYTQDAPIASPYLLSAAIISQAASALQHAHVAKDDDGQLLNIVHRDVSPTNLILSYQGVVKLVDFGVAKASIQEHKTRAGMVKGKYRYMSPEQLSGYEIDRRSDIFSLGIVLYELSTNVGLFRRKTESETIQAIHHDPIVPPSTFDKRYPQMLEEILMRSLARNTQERYQSCDEFRRDLESFLRHETPETFDSHHVSNLMLRLFTDEEELDRSGVSRPPLSRDDIKRFGSQELSAIQLMQSAHIGEDHTPTGNYVAQISHQHPGQANSAVRQSSPPTKTEISAVPPAVTHEESLPPIKGHSNLPLYLLLVFIGIGVLFGAYYLSRSTPQRTDEGAQTWSAQIDKVHNHLRRKQYFSAGSVLKKLDKREKSEEQLEQLNALKAQLKWGPKLDYIRQWIKDGDKLLAIKQLQKLNKTYPNVIRIQALLRSLEPSTGNPKAIAPPRILPARPRVVQPQKRRHRRRYRRLRRRPPRRIAKSPERIAPAIPKTGKLFLNTTPRSRVELNGSLLGYTPLNGRKIPTGTHTLVLSAAGHIKMTRSINVSPNRAIDLNLRLLRIPEPRRRIAKIIRRRPVIRKPHSRTRYPFSAARIKKRTRLRIFISDRRGIVGRQYTDQHRSLARKIEREAARLLGSRYAVRGITIPWQKFVRKQAARRNQAYFTFYPKAVVYLIFRYMSKGRSKRRVAQLLVSYQRRRKFRRVRLP